MNVAVDILVLLALLQFKHFVVDFTSMQTPYMYLNKGNPRHPGGYYHALLHVFCTLLTLQIASYCTGTFTHMAHPLAERAFVIPVLQCAVVEFVWHWVTDLVKTDVVKVKGWKADKHQQFWTALGVDQLSHQWCYLVMVAILLKPQL